MKNVDLDYPFPIINRIRGEMIQMFLSFFRWLISVCVYISITPKNYPTNASVSRHVFFPERAIAKSGMAASEKRKKN